MADDPRAVLKAAGVECAEVEAYSEERRNPADGAGFWDGLTFVTTDSADAAILALARLVAGQAKEMQKQETFIALLKGMVEQLEGDEFEGYDLDELLKRARDV